MIACVGWFDFLLVGVLLSVPYCIVYGKSLPASGVAYWIFLADFLEKGPASMYSKYRPTVR